MLETSLELWVLKSRPLPLHEGRRWDQGLPAAGPEDTPRKGVLPGLLSVYLPHLPGQPNPCPQVTGRVQNVLL